MATLKMTGGSLFEAITSGANAVGGIFNTVNSGVQILNNKTQEVLDDQKDQRVINRKKNRQQAIKNAAVENSRLNESIRLYVGSDEVKKSEVEEFVKELEEEFLRIDKKDSE